MTLRPPQSNANTARESVLGYEIAQEQAAALSRLGRALETALAALSRHDHTAAARNTDAANRPSPAGPPRDGLVQAASEALWCFIVQREACGLRDQRLIIRSYGVPAEVQNRMGTFGKSTHAHAP
jgi:hypothetical protein